MTVLTNPSPASSYPAVMTVGTGFSGLTTALQQVGDGIGNYSPLHLSTTSVNIDTSMGPLEIGGIALTVTATQINDVCGSTDLIESVNGTQDQIFVTTAGNDVTISLTDTVDIVTALQVPEVNAGTVNAGNLILSLSKIETTGSRNITFAPDNTGAVNLNNTTDSVPLRWYNQNGDYMGLRAGQNANNVTWALPADDSVGTQYMTSDGAGNLGWSDAITSVTGTANQVTANTVANAVTLSLPNDVVMTTSVKAGNLKLLGNTLSSQDAAGNINLAPNTTGSINLINGTNIVPLRWFNAAGTNFVGFKAGVLAGNTTWTLPVADSAGTQALVSDGAGALSWQSFGDVTSITGTANQITASSTTGDVTLSLPSAVVISTSIKAGNLKISGNILNNEVTDTDLTISAGGTGGVSLNNGATAMPLKWYNAAGTHFVALKAGNPIANVTWALPEMDSTGTQALVSNGAGVMSWASTVGGVTSIAGTANRVTASASTGAVTLDISGSYVGQSSITTLGTIGTGVWQGTVVGPTYGGTGVNNGASTVTLAGNLVTSGANSLTLTTTGATNVTLPTSGTLLTSASAVTSITGTANQIVADVSIGDVTLSLPDDVVVNSSIQSEVFKVGGLGLTIDPSIGIQAPGAFNIMSAGFLGLFTNGGDITLGAGGGFQFGVELSNGATVVPLRFFNAGSTHFVGFQAGNPAADVTWTLPTTDSTGTQFLKSDGSGVMGWASAVTSVTGTTNRITSSGGATPAIDISASYVGQSSITTLGTIGTGTWQGTIVGPTYGGTGINNGAKTITLGGNLVTSGASSLTLTTTGATNVTLPTSGTLLTSAGAVTSIAGTANQITASASAGAVTMSLPSAITLPGTLTATLGNITGVWEYGTWSIKMGDSTGLSGTSSHLFSTSTANGQYIRFYNGTNYVYFCTIQLVWTNKNSASGALLISLPATVGGSWARSTWSIGYVNNITYVGQLEGGSDSGLAFVNFNANRSGLSPAGVNCADFSTSGEIQLSGMFYTG